MEKPLSIERISSVPTCQPGIFDKRYPEHLFVEYVVCQSVEPAKLAATMSDIMALASSKALIVLAFGPDLWGRLPGGFGFASFALEGLASSQGDLLLWIQGDTRADVVDIMQAAHRQLATLASAQLEVPAFVYH